MRVSADFARPGLRPGENRGGCWVGEGGAADIYLPLCVSTNVMLLQRRNRAAGRDARQFPPQFSLDQEGGAPPNTPFCTLVEYKHGRRKSFVRYRTERPAQDE